MEDHKDNKNKKSPNDTNFNNHTKILSSYLPKDVLEEIDINDSSKTNSLSKNIVHLINQWTKVQNLKQITTMEIVIIAIAIIVITVIAIIVEVMVVTTIKEIIVIVVRIAVETQTIICVI